MTTSLDAAQGYDLVANTYDDWVWNRFWDENEAPFVQQCIEKMPTGCLLDAGCGTGRYRKFIESAGHSYIGVDVSEKMLDVNASKTNDGITARQARLFVGDIRKCPVKTSSVDGVLCTRVLSQVDSIKSAFAELSRIMRHGSVCIVTDVHALHPYGNTTIPSEHGKVSIKTYKWTSEQFFETAKYSKLKILTYQDWTSDQLPRREASSHFDKLYNHPSTKVFYASVLRRV